MNQITLILVYRFLFYFFIVIMKSLSKHIPIKCKDLLPKCIEVFINPMIFVL